MESISDQLIIRHITVLYYQTDCQWSEFGVVLPSDNTYSCSVISTNPDKNYWNQLIQLCHYHWLSAIVIQLHKFHWLSGINPMVGITLSQGQTNRLSQVLEVVAPAMGARGGHGWMAGELHSLPCRLCLPVGPSLTGTRPEADFFGFRHRFVSLAWRGIYFGACGKVSKQ